VQSSGIFNKENLRTDGTYSIYSKVATVGKELVMLISLKYENLTVLLLSLQGIILPYFAELPSSAVI